MNISASTVVINQKKKASLSTVLELN